jgi:TubC N-terminal docking domain
MTPLDLIERLRSIGVILALSSGGTIRYKAPQGVMTAELSEAMRIHKAALLDLVGRREDAEISQSPPCFACNGTDRWDDHGILRCVVCYPPGSMTLKRTMETLLACRRCGSLAPPVGGTPYEDGSMLLRCPDCNQPRAVIAPPQHKEDV